MATASAGPSVDLIAQRFKEKIQECDGINPWDIKDDGWLPAHVDNMPRISQIDLFNYLVLQTSFYTGRQMKAKKSLLAHNFYVSGFVERLRSCHMSSDRVLVTADVKHSQSMNAAMLRPWVLAHQDGTICVGHCTCMAGLDEVCSHVAAVIFAVESGVRLTELKSCTSLPCAWIMPGAMKKVPYAEVRRMDLRSTNRKKKEMDTAGKLPTPLVDLPKVAKHKDEPSTDDICTLIRQIHMVYPQAGILSVSQEFHQEYTPKHNHSRPQVLTELRDVEGSLLPYHKLIHLCKNIKLEALTKEAITAVEFTTRKQVKSPEWYKYRAGRVTASNLWGTCKTALENPSVSLIRKICYPSSNSFSSEAIRWGNENEAKARAEYTALLSATHVSLDVSDCGLMLNSKYLEMGASPDGKVTCHCCGTGFVEIKCPFTLKGVDLGMIQEEQLPATSCLELTDGYLHLKHDHEYYYQVQAQIMIGEAEYCDFVAWTGQGCPHIERILPDMELWDAVQPRVQAFFKKGVLPELVGGWYTRPYVKDVPHADGLYCYCGEGEKDTMIFCENEGCIYQWYHTACLLISVIPHGKWKCPSCRKELQQRSKNAKKRVK